MLRVSGQGLEFLGFVVLARRLAPSDFGTLSVAFLIARYGGLVGDFGASVRGVRDVAALATPNALRSYQRRRVEVTAAAALIYIGVAVTTSHATVAPLVVTLISRGMNRDWMALGSERGIRAGAPLALQGFLVASVSLVVSSVGTAALALGVAYGASLVVSLVANPMPPSDGHARVPVDGWLLIATLADQITISTDTVLLAALRSTREAGIYAAMYRIPNAWLTLIGLIVIGMVPGTTRQVVRNPLAIRAASMRNLRVGATAALVVLITAPPIVVASGALFGRDYRSGRTALAILLAATAINAVAASLHPIYLALGRDRAQSAIASSAAALNFSANLVLIPAFGMVAAASTTLAAQVLLLLCFGIGVWRASSPAAT